jgi:hypothetical protein
LAVPLALLALAGGAGAQSGGTFDLTWNTVDGGGGTGSQGGTFVVQGTSGQPDAGAHTGGTFVLQGGFWNGDVGPTAVELVWFDARPNDTGIEVAWQTAVEVDLLGFHLYRAAEGQGMQRLNASLIPTQAPGAPVGALYTWQDNSADLGIAYAYTLEAVDVRGAGALFGPVWTSWPGPPKVRLYLPLVTKP